MRVALLTNFVPPYRVPFFEAIAERVDRLLVLTSTRMEAGRPWRFAPGSLDVVVQRTLSFAQTQDAGTFHDRVAVHVPIDTAAQLRGFAPDVIVTGEFGARTIAATYYGRRHEVPVVVWATLSERSEARRGIARRLVRERLLRSAQHVIVNGASGERYVRAFGVSAERITRVPATTRMEPFLALPLEPPSVERLRVLFVGNLIPRKAPGALLAAAREIAAAGRPIDLTFVGDGPLRAELEAGAASPPPGLAVRFAGAVDYDELPALYARADVLAFPTLADEWGLVVNEALAAGVPVLGSLESQAVQELVVDGQNGWLLDECTPAGVARGVARVRDTTPTEHLRMKRRARASAAGLDPSVAADRVCDVLASVVGVGTR
jgi:glycosyltransferase involved in cell wall biosynthesis